MIGATADGEEEACIFNHAGEWAHFQSSMLQSSLESFVCRVGYASHDKSTSEAPVC